MTTGHVFIATSLDGYIARSDGGIDWLTSFASSGEDHGYSAFIARMDGLVMGRGTYQKVLTFGTWPYDKPVVVLSRSLTSEDVPAELAGRVEVMDGSPREVMDRLTVRGWARAYVDGGKVIQAFLRAGLIEDMTVSRIPVLIGNGLPLFGPLDRDYPLTHIETQAFVSGLVQSKYALLPTT